MIKIIVHAFIEGDELGVVEILFASKDEQAISTQMASLTKLYPNDYLAVYDLPLDTDLKTLPHYPSVAIEKSDFADKKN